MAKGHITHNSPQSLAPGGRTWWAEVGRRFLGEVGQCHGLGGRWQQPRGPKRRQKPAEEKKVNTQVVELC